MHIIVKEFKKKKIYKKVKKTLNSNSIAKAYKNGSRMSDLAPLDPGVTIELLRTDIPSQLRVTE